MRGFLVLVAVGVVVIAATEPGGLRASLDGLKAKLRALRGQRTDDVEADQATTEEPS